MGFASSAALLSCVGLVASFVLLVLGFIYLWYCYFPGGYKRDEVMDIGDYAMFVAQAKYEERKKKLSNREEDSVNEYDELHYDVNLTSDLEGGQPRKGNGGSDWQSVATSEDIEGATDLGGTSSSSPSSRSPTQGQYEYDDGQSVPSSTAPSQRSLKPALKLQRDDHSESTNNSGSTSTK